MRAAYIPESNFVRDEVFTIKGEKIHHLLNVVRLKVDSDLLLLDGEGKSAVSKVLSISKKEVQVLVKEVRSFEDKESLSIAFAQPKKEALEICLRNCVEVGAKRIFILSSERSQSYPLKEDRINKILTGGLEQSNNPFFPQCIQTTLEQLPFNDYEKVLLASLAKPNEEIQTDGRKLLLIGPEGGFSENEEAMLLKKQNMSCVNFDGPILRAPTAISFFAGRLTS